MMIDQKALQHVNNLIAERRELIRVRTAIQTGDGFDLGRGAAFPSQYPDADKKLRDFAMDLISQEVAKCDEQLARYVVADRSSVFGESSVSKAASVIDPSDPAVERFA